MEFASLCLTAAEKLKQYQETDPAMCILHRNLHSPTEKRLKSKHKHEVEFYWLNSKPMAGLSSLASLFRKFVGSKSLKLLSETISAGDGRCLDFINEFIQRRISGEVQTQSSIKLIISLALVIKLCLTSFIVDVGKQSFLWLQPFTFADTTRNSKKA